LNSTPLIACIAFVLAGAAGSACAAGKAHVHGVMKLDVTIESNKLTIAMEAPLDNLLGFERAPRTDAERKAAADVLVRLRSVDKGTPLFRADAAAQCVLSKSEVQAPVLEPVAKPATPPAAKPVSKSDHADLEAFYEYTCALPKELRSLEVGLLEAYPRAQRIEVQLASPQGQSKVTLRRPARTVKLVR
jgi:hypothetical protein